MAEANGRPRRLEAVFSLVHFLRVISDAGKRVEN
jgi:hypothetical protein